MSLLRTTLLTVIGLSLVMLSGCATTANKPAAKKETPTRAQPRPDEKADAPPTPRRDEGGTKKTGPAQVTLGAPDVSGNVTRAAVNAALEPVPVKVYRCATAMNAPPIGTLQVSLHAAAEGKLVGAQVADDSIGDVTLAQCTIDAFNDVNVGATTDGRPAFIKVDVRFDRAAR